MEGEEYPLEDGELREPPAGSKQSRTPKTRTSAFVNPSTARRLNSPDHISPDYKERSNGADGPDWKAESSGDIET